MAIDVVIPVGPFPSNRRWLDKCLDSVRRQTMSAAHIIVVDDSVGFGEPVNECQLGADVRIIQNPWRLGVAASFNVGVASAPSECVLMMGSDDELEPECLGACWDTYIKHEMRPAYYWLDVRYINSGEIQSIACNAAMVTKGLWKLTGGIPVEAAVGAGDAALLSIMIAHMPKRIIRVDSKPEHPLYLYRDHGESDTIQRSSKWHQVIIDVRGLVTEEWQKR